MNITPCALMSTFFLILCLAGPFPDLCFRIKSKQGIKVRKVVDESHNHDVSQSPLKIEFMSGDKKTKVELLADEHLLQKEREPMKASIMFSARPNVDGNFNMFLQARGRMSEPWAVPWGGDKQKFINLEVLPEVLNLQLAMKTDISEIKLQQVNMVRQPVGPSNAQFQENTDINFVRNRVPGRMTQFFIDQPRSDPPVKFRLALNSGMSWLALKDQIHQRTGIAMAKQRISIRDPGSSRYYRVQDHAFASDAILHLIPLSESGDVHMMVDAFDIPYVQKSYTLGDSQGLELYYRNVVEEKDVNYGKKIAKFEIWANSGKPDGYTFLKFTGFGKSYMEFVSEAATSPVKFALDPLYDVPHMKLFVSEAATPPVKFWFILNLENTTKVSLFPPEAAYVNTGWIPLERK